MTPVDQRHIVIGNDAHVYLRNGGQQAVELGDAGHALRVAARADTNRLSPELQARLLIDVARAYAQRCQPHLLVCLIS